MSADLATQLGIPLVSMNEVDEAAQTFDGADEVDPNLDLIKGYGGALVREKIVAAFSRKLVILVGDEKIVAKLGARGKLPVEVVPFGEALCNRELKALGCRPVRRQVDGKTFVTDNGNHILDCGIDPIANPADFERTVLAIPGVVGSGLFLGMAQTVIIEKGDQVEVRERSK